MVEFTTDQLITIGVALVTGIGSSFGTLRYTHQHEDKKEKETTKRVRALIIAELESVRKHLQHWLDASRGESDSVSLFSKSVEVEYNNYLIDNLQYLALDVNLKLKSFKPNELRELHSVYTQIKTIQMFRTTTPHVGDMAYKKADLQAWVENIGRLIEKLNTTS
ncbi:hypothetical protein [Candidatus Nitrososphaera sp. FF02]|uniref:hypothetical protein n=1 Tax=Candidatus Nitrososphaera sp. FF02 TaxID=3398226 RepID=UPI0039E814F3